MRNLILITLLLLSSQASAEEVLLKPEAFIAGAFSSEKGVLQTLWLNDQQKSRASAILGRKFNGFRVRYWVGGKRTAWILEEVGKELPISIGVVVEKQQVVDVKVLVYRESRGGEVRYPFFLKQFSGLTLKGEGLDGNVDGVTGATLSVRAVKRVVALALYLDQQVKDSQ